MAHRYFPHTNEDVETMLNVCKVNTLEDLYSDVPEELIFKREYNLPSEYSEEEVRDFFKHLLKKNVHIELNLAGGGYYIHSIPSVIPNLISRSEFLTAYTPYQPEISQGTLQYIFEYQTLMTRLTGMEISNASLYDGATATAEAMMLAVSQSRKKNRVLISETVNPSVIKVVETYAHYRNIDITRLKVDENGVTSRSDFEQEISKGDVAGVIVATPNFYGILEDYSGWSEICHAQKSLFIINSVASDLVSIKSPAEWRADIAVGDAQSLGIPLSFGGPYLGYICCSKNLMRKIPGRIVGMTKDSEGRRSFVLTLQAREQHIRREKATSNICSNQGLMALYVTIYMSLLGLKGLKKINQIGVDGAHWLAEKLIGTGKASLTYPNSVFFNEFCLTFNSETILDQFISKANEASIIPGIRLNNTQILIAVTETASKVKLQKLISILENL